MSRARRATGQDADAAAELLHAFNVEFGDPSPGPQRVAARLVALMAGGDTFVLLAGDGPDGVAVVRLRAALWSEAQEAYLAELYVTPARRGEGLGRELLDAVLAAAREAGADRIELGTEEDDTAARALYESTGFTNRPFGSRSLYYERDL